MAEFIHATEAEIKGPFLIDRSQLEALDKILGEEWSRFGEERKRALHQAVEKEFKVERAGPFHESQSDEQLRRQIRSDLEQSVAFKERKEFFVFLRNGSAAKVPDFVSALREPDLHDKEPNGLYAVLESCSRSCEVTLTGRYSTLRVEVSPRRDQFVQQTLMVLKNWQNSVRPPKWQSLWLKLNGLQWFIWFAAMVASFFLMVQRAENASARQFGQEAAQLLTNDLSADKQGKAIQLLLAKTYGYQAQPTKLECPGWFLLSLFGGLAYCIALSFKPDVAIAIGRGERNVQNWRKYSKFMLITTPTFVFMTFMWPRIEHILKSIF